MNELGPAGAWLPLRDQHRDACVEALAHARENLARAPFIAVDDLPRVMSGTTLESELALLATAVAEASGTLLLLSHHRMPPSSGELFPSEIHDVPRLDSAEVAEYFEVVVGCLKTWCVPTGYRHDDDYYQSLHPKGLRRKVKKAIFQ
jgi:hypothetical protein